MKAYQTYITLFVAAISLSLGLAANPVYAESEVSYEDIETISVIGGVPLYKLDKNIRKETRAFLKAYNKLNQISKFEIVCRKEKANRTNVSRSYCEPRYRRLARTRLISAAGGMDAHSTRLISDYELRLATEEDRYAAIENMATIINTNPELKEQFLKLQFNVKKSRKRKNS